MVVENPIKWMRERGTPGTPVSGKFHLCVGIIRARSKHTIANSLGSLVTSSFFLLEFCKIFCGKSSVLQLKAVVVGGLDYVYIVAVN